MDQTPPALGDKAAFESVLSNYHINSAARQVLRQTPLVLMAAASSAGRNTIMRQLIASGYYYEVISDTTRPPRENDGVLERDGVEYYFRSEHEMLEGLHKGEYIEAALIHQQQVSGMSAREIMAAAEAGKIAIADIDPQGLETIHRLKPDLIPLFILPPDFSRWQIRMRKRGAMSDEEHRRRLESAIWEFEWVLERSYCLFVVNDSLEHAIAEVDDIARRGKIDKDSQTRARTLVRQLIGDTKSYLARPK